MAPRPSAPAGSILGLDDPAMRGGHLWHPTPSLGLGIPSSDGGPSGQIPIRVFLFDWSDDVISFKELMQGYMHFFIAQVVRAANQLQQFKSQPP